ncbi:MULTISPECIES: glycosyltransferase family 4 protein [unclassified Synechocystis]|uniref:glycosyltransferase family 4 protein n=1 Tax=unclassified Synechocystis TaxID=2640012 RepID=UPI00041094FF|nr:MULTISPECIES: glycosyltransferase family 4 protein [unclassified Synechocystis]AIE74130.1 Glycosyltransferase [Synechocystis sp. PCC 6714]MCT0252770.1 glycosyltransferase family 4 protein [Synechocystis sp. CS-94]
MKILHINQSDISGGAAIASYRLHQGLLSQGIDSKILVDIKKTKNDHIKQINRKRNLENLISRFNYRLGLNYISHFNTFQLTQDNFYQQSDILNLHNLHGDYFNYLALAKLTQEKPAVWTLHDMWSFTGHCAYSYDCKKWKTGCGKCPYLNVVPTVPRDNTAIEWKLKSWVYQRSDLNIVTLSNWLTELTKKSMLNRLSIHHIPNGVNTQDYQPLDPLLCRSVLGIAPKKKVLMFVAFGLSDPRKGSDLLIEALQNLPESLKKETILLTLGEGGENLREIVSVPIISLGYVSGDRLKSIAYSAADLFVFPTRADNLPLVLQESMACGTPMVSFAVGGVPDLVRPGITGELAQPENPQDFARKIVELLEDNKKRAKLGQNCRHIAETEYPIELQAQRYIQLYQQILGKKNIA